MKALVWHGPRQMTVEEVATPRPGQGEVLLRPLAVGICGSELSGYLGENSLRVPPLVMGHEFTGVVEEVGPDAAGLAPGDTVTVNPLIACWQCALCRQGLSNVCLHRRIVGIHCPGAFAERVLVPAASCYRLPPGVDPIRGSLTEPLACAVRAVRLAGVGLASSVLVIGAGPIGLLCMLTARQAGATRILVADINPRRLEVAREWRAQVVNPREVDLLDAVREVCGPLGPDTVIDAVGLPVTRNQAVRAVRPGGQVVFLGLHVDEAPLPGNHISRQEVTIRGSFSYTDHDFRSALDLLAAGVLPPDLSWIDVRGLEQGPASFAELVDNPQAVTKVVLVP